MYRGILQLDPRHAPTNHNLGLLAMQAQQADVALGYFNTALDADPAQGQFWLSYIDALAQTGQQDTARQVLALAQQQGLQGDKVEELKARLEGCARVAQPSDSQQGKGKPVKKSHPHQGKQPAAREIESLVALFNQRRFPEAAVLAKTMTERFPHHWAGWKMQGVLFQQAGRNTDALIPMQKTVSLLPGDAEAHNNLGIVLQHLGRLREAETSYRSAIKLNPKYAHAFGNLGSTLQDMGQLPEADACYRRALQISPDYVKAHNNLAALLLDLGRLEEAEASWRNALRFDAGNVEALSNLGNLLQKMGRLGEAETIHRRVLEMGAHLGEAHYYLANALMGLGKLEEAEACYRQALQIKPDLAEAYGNLGTLLHDLGRLDEAEACYRQALQAKPDYAEAYSNLGSTLSALGYQDRAEASYRQALQIKPDIAEAHSNLGSLLHDLGRLDEAEASLRRALVIKPDFSKAYSNLLFCLNQNANVDAKTLFAEHCRFGERFEAPFIVQRPRHRNSRDASRRLEIGFVSGDLRDHAVAYFIELVIEHLSGFSQLSLHAYSTHNINDSVTQRLRGYFAHWHSVAALPDAALAEKIRADGIDILIDFSGHSAKNRLPVFARKPAPVQATWMGYPGTTGMQAMDYYFSDCFALPPGQFDDQFTEKIVRLPASAPFLPSRNAPPVNDLPALNNGYVTFGSFNRMSKLSPAVVALWAQLLRALPDSRMVLGGMPEDGKYEMLIDCFTREGIARERLDFHKRSGMGAYLDLHHQVDICLDTFPYNGGTTTLHAFWMGVPTVTLAGDTAAGRTGATVLGHVGLESFIARDAADFVRKASSWAGNLAALSNIRAGLRDRFSESAIGRPEIIAEGLARALRIMWQRWCADEPPISFEVTREMADAARETEK
ncbi:MAG: tetratricopeptide repeat protein [Nitrosomonadales bacterium]|nr:tetratricopeptide repeat protein [Nitrosomonadales bacterium]